MSIAIIVAMDRNRLIGNNNQLPWHLSEDLAHFKKITTDKTVIMGRKTYQSIGKPLPKRNNIVISRNKNLKIAGVTILSSLDEICKLANKQQVIIIGGASLYAQVLPLCNLLYITQINHAFVGDAHFPEINLSKWQQISSQKNTIPSDYDYYFKVFIRT